MHLLLVIMPTDFKTVVDHEIVGGAIVQIDDQTHHNHLDFLYVDTAHQNKGIGYKIWTALEQKYPQTVLWETCTPYFDKRNIHFYINRCGFAAVRIYITKDIQNLTMKLRMILIMKCYA